MDIIPPNSFKVNQNLTEIIKDSQKRLQTIKICRLGWFAYITRNKMSLTSAGGGREASTACTKYLGELLV